MRTTTATTSLRDYQVACRQRCEALALRSPGSKTLFVAPTGAGKTHMMLSVLSMFGADAWLLTPSLEIIKSILGRLGLDVASMSEAKMHREAFARQITTPTRLRNRLRTGKVAPESVSIILGDEAHHNVAAGKVTGDIAKLLPAATWLGWTATPYRGSAKETEALKAFWGEAEILLTIPQAAERRFISIPKPTLAPLVDDGKIELKNGEFVGALAGEAISEDAALAGLVAVARERYGDGFWKRPTMIAVPSAESRAAVVAALAAAGMCAEEISGETSQADRIGMLHNCERRLIALVQIKVLAEGVDMPWLRTLIDARPIASPVAWLQLVGRITRPVAEGEDAPEYVCTNRNAERFAYLMQGCWPSAEIAAETEGDFGTPERSGPLSRGIAKDALRGRAPVKVKLADGRSAAVLHIASSTNWGSREEVLAVGIPGEELPRVWKRVNDGKFGRWESADLAADGYKGWIRGGKGGTLTEGMMRWFKGGAAERGLDRNDEPCRRGFALFAALVNTNASLLPVEAVAKVQRSAERKDERKAGARERIDAVKASIADGYYATERNGAVSFWRLQQPTAGKWKGYTFLATVTGGPGRANETSYRNMAGKATVLEAIAADVKGAAILFGRELGFCGACGSPLTDAKSRAAGIGPICAKR